MEKILVLLFLLNSVSNLDINHDSLQKLQNQSFKNPSFNSKQQEEKNQFNGRNKELETGLTSRRVLIKQKQLYSRAKQILKILGTLFSILRNVIILGVVLNKFSLLIYLILFNEFILILSFSVLEKQCLCQFYQTVLTSNFDIFNLIRFTVSSAQKDPNALTILQTYQMKSSIFLNLFGEIIFLSLFFVFTLIVKGLNVIVNSENLRKLNQRMKPMWIGFIFSLFPRITVLSGLQLRNIYEFTSKVIIQGCFAGFLIAGLVGFFVFFITQVYKLNKNIESFEENILNLGVAGKLAPRADFQFDCIKFSNLYYPAINYLRLFLMSMFIGFSPDLNIVQLGFSILVQLCYFVALVCCKPYIKKVENIFTLLIQFFCLVIILLVISTNFTVSTSENSLTTKTQLVFFAILIICWILLFVLLGLDIKESCGEKTNEVSNESQKEDDLSENYSMMLFGKKEKGKPAKSDRKKNNSKKSTYKVQIQAL